MMNRYLFPLKYLVNLNSHSNFKFEGKIKFIAFTKFIQAWDSTNEDSDIPYKY
jgi:hypothetical protein